jgi:hypothetical protein
VKETKVKKVNAFETKSVNNYNDMVSAGVLDWQMLHCCE